MRQILVTYRGNIDQSYFHALVKSFYANAQVTFLNEERPEEGKKAGRGRNKRDEEYEGEPLIFRISREESGEAFFSIGEEGSFEKSARIEGSDEKSKSEAFKNFVYLALSEYCDKTLPWGSLMGVRPTKLGRRWLAAWEERQSGRSDEELAAVIARQYEDTYHVSKAKAELAADIAIREEKLIKRLDPDKGFSLYVGVPFCPTRCLYCSFTSNAIGACSRLVEPTLEAMKKEIREAGSILRHNRPDTVYIGGGTPTSLSAEQLEDLMGAIGESFDLSGTLEYTVEAGRADSITPEKLSVIRKMGAGRISVNPQTMQDETLSLIGRKASSDQVIRAFEMAREEGFDHINMDLILGLPGEDAAKVADTLAKVEALRPDSMTVHTLAVKRGSDLHRIMTEKGYPLNPDTAPAMELAYEAAKRMRLKPYYLYRQKNMSGNQENVGFAKEGKFGIYNILIMEEVQSVYAVGAGTVSKRVYSEGGALKIERCDTHKDVELYIAGIDEMCERKRRLFCGGKE